MIVKRFLFWIPSIVWAIILFSLSNTPGNELPSLKFGLDKLAHISVYCIFSYLIIFAFTNSTHKDYFHKIYYSFLIAFLYGVFEEYHQLFVPGRFFSYGDMYANLIGSVAGVLIWHFNIFHHKEKILKLIGLSK